MNYKRFKKYLVTDNTSLRPMVYQRQDARGGQFVFCGTEVERKPLPVKIYTHTEARRLIAASVKWRREKNMKYSELDYVLMPVR